MKLLYRLRLKRIIKQLKNMPYIRGNGKTTLRDGLIHEAILLSTKIVGGSNV